MISVSFFAPIKYLGILSLLSVICVMLEMCLCPLASWLLRRHKADIFSNSDVSIVDERLNVPTTAFDGRT
jgi:hypothetical protein